MPSITGTRDALNGYQKSKCYYCYRDISITQSSGDLADVDHFLPCSLITHGIADPIGGVWKLVLACQTCNRGAAGKFDLLPDVKYLERLDTRNEHLIASHRPLRDTLMKQTGSTDEERHAFLQRGYLDPRALLVDSWRAEHEFEATF